MKTSMMVCAIYLLLPALVLSEPGNLRGTSIEDVEMDDLFSTNETDDREANDDILVNGTDDQEALRDFLNEASVLSSYTAARRRSRRRVGAKKCVDTVKANQCLMSRASKANKLWEPDWTWTKYEHSDAHLSSKNLRTDCSGFVGWAIRGCANGLDVLDGVKNGGPGRVKRKRARNFYDAFGPGSLGSRKFCRVEDFRQVQRGDLLVYDKWTQLDSKPGDSGHIMIAFRSPIPRGVTSDGKLVFAQKIIDSTANAHFDFLTFEETRRNCPKDGKCGAGVGYVYVWTDSHGRVLAIRLRGKTHRNELDCHAKKDGRFVDVPCYPQTNHENHNYRIGRLRN